MNNSLGKWAILDIETTGLNPDVDEIIDIGYLLFENFKLVKTYNSLVFTENVPQIITKLTGITGDDLFNAPNIDEVIEDISELNGIKILCHNSKFEQSFLSKYFSEDTEFIDSIIFLSFLFPFFESYKLENFITFFKIRDYEIHRGYEDSLDLLKVILLSLENINNCFLLNNESFHKYSKSLILSSMQYLGLQDTLFFNLISINQDEIYKICDDIKFDLDVHKKKLINFEEEHKRNDFLNHDKLEFTGEFIKNLFQRENDIKKIIPKYRYRNVQEELSLRVGQSFKNNVHSIIQAPTGTGKTLGYLIPSLLYSKETSDQVFVATATKALQSQILQKDITLVKNILGFDDSEIKVSYIIGSDNHLCELLYRRDYLDSQSDLFESLDDELDKTLKLFIEIIFFYNSFKNFNEQITRNKIPYILKKIFKNYENLDDNIKADYRTCIGFQCNYKKNCSYFNSLQEAKESKILIGNHSLLFHLPKSIEWPKKIVIDESHKIEGEITNAYTLCLSKNMLEKFLNQLNRSNSINSLFYLIDTENKESKDKANIKKIVLEVYENVQVCFQNISSVVEEVFSKSHRFSSEYWNEIKFSSYTLQNDYEKLNNYLIDLLINIHGLEKKLHIYDLKWDLSSSKDENFITALTKFKTFYNNILDILLPIELLVIKFDNDINIETRNSEHALYCENELSYSLRYHVDYGFEFTLKPIDSGHLIYEKILKNTESVVMTSATLTNSIENKQALEWSSGHTHLNPLKRFKNPLLIDPIFDYENNAKVFLCDDTPSLYDENFIDIVFKEVLPMIREIGGKTLLLFSSKKRFNIAVNYFIEEIDHEIPVFVQGFGSNIVDEFKKLENAILIGMESFSEGIDIPGKSLQFLFIDKIPDLNYDQITQDRRDFFNSEFGNEFENYYLFNRTRKLHQKLGRLIRSENDTGSVIIVDSRIKKWKSRTIDSFNSLMLPYKINRTSLKNACDLSAEFILNSNNNF